MNKILSMCTILILLVFFGCGQSEESKSVEQSAEAAKEKVTDAAKAVAGEVKEVTGTVADKTIEMEKQAEPVIKETVQDTKDMAVAAADKTHEMITEAKDTTEKAADTVTDNMKTAAVATTIAADKAVEAAKQAVSPETLVLEASYGNVTFPHTMHSEEYECSTCHGDETPGLFGLDKATAHELCKNCHKQKGAGPTDCKGCHKK
jgi:hypothetical protein